MDTQYIIAQILGVIGWTLYLLSFHAKRENKVIFMQILASTFYGLNYGLLGAWSGLFVSALETIRSIGYYKTDKDKYIFRLSVPVYILIGIFSEDSIVGILPIAASLLESYATLKSKKFMVIGGAIGMCLWIVYGFFYADYVGILTDLLILVSNLSILLNGYSKFLRRDRVYTVSGLYISANTMEELHHLDKGYYDSQYLWDVESMKELYKSEKNSYILVKDNNKIIGYVNILNLRKEVYDKMIESQELFDEFQAKDILNFEIGKQIYLNINSIVLKSEYHNKDSIEKISHAIDKFISMRKKKGYKIKEISSISVNEFESDVLENLGFEKVRDITNESFLYVKKY